MLYVVITTHIYMYRSITSGICMQQVSLEYQGIVRPSELIAIARYLGR